MRVKGTFFTSIDTEEELKRNLEVINNAIEDNPYNISLQTDEDIHIGCAERAYIEDDHIVIEYEVDENFKDLLVSEGFSILY